MDLMEMKPLDFGRRSEGTMEIPCGGSFLFGLQEKWKTKNGTEKCNEWTNGNDETEGKKNRGWMD